MALATSTETAPEFKSAFTDAETPRRLACLGCGNHLQTTKNSRTSDGEWVIRSRCPDCGLQHVHRRKHPPPD